MSWKRSMLEAAIAMAARVSLRGDRPDAPRSIFVLRNNDLGDLLVVTPLFAALRRGFPSTRIVAGVGPWSADLLRHNPNVDAVMPVSAPWHNRVTGTRDPRAALHYLFRSPEVEALRNESFEVGIDVLGSPFGSLLLMRAGIPWRLGVKGYAGGHTGAHQVVHYNGSEHVGRASLRFAELLGCTSVMDWRPQVFLESDEIAAAHQVWTASCAASARRIIVAPGGGHPGRAWPANRFAALVSEVGADPGVRVAVIGGAGDASLTAQVAGDRAIDLGGRLSLRESMALIATSHLVYSNSSIAMHAAAAFDIPAIVLLGNAYESARAHAAQWGHGPRTFILGRDHDRTEIFDPREVLLFSRRLDAVAAHHG
jgi:ADP-heptose:LPS heptosyltransferase